MLEKIKSFMLENKIIAISMGVVAVVMIAYAIGHYRARQSYTEKPTIVTQEETQEVKTLRQQLDISKSNADVLQRYIANAQKGQKPPVATYYINTPTVEQAAKVVERQMKEDAQALPQAAREKSDRTIITPITKDKDGKELSPDQQRVDIYKVNLNKAHKIKTGITQIDTHTYWTAGVQIGKWEALAHGQAQNVKGATIVYTIAEW